MTAPRITIFDDPDLAHKYASAASVRHVSLSGDGRKQLSTLIALGGSVQRGKVSYALSFAGASQVTVPTGRMMLRILLGAGAAGCVQEHSAGFHPALPLHGFPIVAPSNDLRQLISILDRTGTAQAAIERGPGIGSWSSESVLLLGDRPSNTWPETAPNYPFISAYRSGCSEWLAQQLEDGGVPESSLYWSNTYTQKGDRLPFEWIERLKPRGIITLGNAAQAWLDGAGLKSSYQVHHPQYWKRFHSKDTYVLPRYVTKLLG